MNNFVNDGSILSLTAPYTVASGAGAKVGSIFGVATGAFTSGSAGEFLVKGRVLLTAKTSQAWAVGDRLYWDDTNKWVSNTSTDGQFIGLAAVAKGSSPAVGDVNLFPAPELLTGAQAAITALTDSTGGAVSNTLHDVTVTPTQTLVNNNFASLSAKVDAILTALTAAGIL